MKTKLLTLCLALFATTNLFSADFEKDGIAYNILTENTVEVTSTYPYYIGSITIPKTVTYNYTTYSVTTIGERAFYYCSGLTSIEIPNSVTTIGVAAFSCCSGLTSITIPNSVTTIGGLAFSGCSGLTSVTIGNSVKTIGIEAFRGCSGLTSIEIPNSVTTIGSSAFRSCSGLTSVTIPNSVTTIGSYAFDDCRDLKGVYITDLAAWCKINFSVGANPLEYAHDLYLNDQWIKDLFIPNSVTSIGEYAFKNSWSFSVIIPNSVTTIGKYAFYNCSYLTSLTIPNSVTNIGKSAFENCSNITSVTIGNSVMLIEERAFRFCDDLTSITCYAVTPPECGDNVFDDAIIRYAKVYVYVPASALADYQNAEVWKDMQLFPIAADVTPIEDDNPTVTPSNQDVTITWPITEGTDTYTLTISKNGEIVCVLTFNAQGQLTNIAFAAPGHNGAHQASAATLTATGYQFTVTGLTPGTAYDYSVTATNAGGQTIAEHKGNFSTTGGTPTSINGVHGSQCTPEGLMQKVLRNGQILLKRNNTTYTLMGQKVK